MRVVIVGAGEVGSAIAAGLAPDNEVVVVDVDRDRVEALQYDVDVLGVAGDGADLDTLEEAAVEEADMLIASTDDDETNIVTCGTAATVAPDCFTIARVRNTKFLETWRRADSALGVDFMVGTNLLTAETNVRVIGTPGARDVEPFAEGAVQMAEFAVHADSPVADQTVSEADRFDSLTFAAIIRNGDVAVPSGETAIDAGDDVVVIGSPESVRSFGDAVAPGTPRVEDVVVVGGSDVARHTASLLVEQGLTPRLIERDPERARELAEALPEVSILQSDATDRAFLEREHVGDADVAVAALDSDEKNLLAALLAKRVGADRAVAVVDNGGYVSLFEEVGVDVAINPGRSPPKR